MAELAVNKERVEGKQINDEENLISEKTSQDKRKSLKYKVLTASEVEKLIEENKQKPMDKSKPSIFERFKEAIFTKVFRAKAEQYKKLEERLKEQEKIELKKIIDMQREELKELRKELSSKDNSQKNIKEKETLKKDNSKDLIKKSAKEIKSMVLEHKEWIESKGKRGKKLNLENVDLQGKKLLNVDLREANFKNANLNNCTIYADLRGADLTGVKLNDKTNFIGSNLNSITIENEKRNIIKDKLDKSIDKHRVALKELKTNKKEQNYEK
ncbi:pentapeptide repeat-containing protein [Clostridium faecium]|uniref:Pentapeptide repeat-containing protein n=1 Tax=Clostridium faecium TaxID=2762223 RepID=A0ABR8YNI5_9CLOT|nr:pentapeptide repeat-containing protein [Clostridium faecium]MBD8045808.1 pentapeptide repeat-containing protein [Clostridium faecium]